MTAAIQPPAPRAFDEAGWIKHDGGGRPHPPASHVEVRFRDGRVEQGCSAFLRWPWADADDPDFNSDVLAWRNAVIPPTKDETIASLCAVLERVVSDCQLAHDVLGNSPPEFASVQQGFAIIGERARAALAKARGQ